MGVKTKFYLSIMLAIIVDYLSNFCLYLETRGLNDDLISIPTIILVFISAYLLYDVSTSLDATTKNLNSDTEN